MRDYYFSADRRSNTERLKRLKQLCPETAEAWLSFDARAFEAGDLDNKAKHLVGLAVAHTTGCPYCIDYRTRKAFAAGASEKAIAEVVFIAMVMSAGKCWAHSAITMETVEEKLAATQKGE